MLLWRRPQQIYDLLLYPSESIEITALFQTPAIPWGHPVTYGGLSSIYIIISPFISRQSQSGACDIQPKFHTHFFLFFFLQKHTFYVEWSQCITVRRIFPPKVFSFTFLVKEKCKFSATPLTFFRLYFYLIIFAVCVPFWINS